jgi:flavin reductase (DIM6/NTAB) family NADH-FMN oxidoreductase RutF
MPKIELKPGNQLFPLPACLLTCGPPEASNIITLAWVGSLCSEPPIMGVSIRPSRHSHSLVATSGEFVLNVPTVEILRAVDYCGSVSGRDTDKWKAMGLTPAPARIVRTALIAECPLNLECRVVQTIRLGSHDLFLGTVVAVHADERILDSRGEIDPGKADPIAYGGHDYWSLGRHLERQGFARPR